MDEHHRAQEPPGAALAVDMQHPQDLEEADASGKETEQAKDQVSLRHPLLASLPMPVLSSVGETRTHCPSDQDCLASWPQPWSGASDPCPAPGQPFPTDSNPTCPPWGQGEGQLHFSKLLWTLGCLLGKVYR
jgi:hypothetical protein